MCLKRCRDRVTHMTLDPSLFTSFLLIYHPLLFYEIICSTHFSRLLHAQCISTCAIMTTLHKRRALYNPMSINPKITMFTPGRFVKSFLNPLDQLWSSFTKLCMEGINLEGHSIHARAIPRLSGQPCHCEPIWKSPLNVPARHRWSGPA